MKIVCFYEENYQNTSFDKLKFDMKYVNIDFEVNFVSNMCFSRLSTE